jgi:hypothetical protein
MDVYRTSGISNLAAEYGTKCQWAGWFGTENKISNSPKVRKPSCEHMDGQCLVI